MNPAPEQTIGTSAPVGPDPHGQAQAIERTMRTWLVIIDTPSTSKEMRQMLVEQIGHVYDALRAPPPAKPEPAPAPKPESKLRVAP